MTVPRIIPNVPPRMALWPYGQDEGICERTRITIDCWLANMWPKISGCSIAGIPGRESAAKLRELEITVPHTRRGALVDLTKKDRPK